MSATKLPQEKKRLSLERDCRNTYGENSKSSRRNIRQGKQRSHMLERRVASQSLTAIKGSPDEDAVVAAESEARVRLIQSHLKAFRKTPDTPLKEVLKRKRVTGRRYAAIAALE
jgi:chorismate-pyruvate lyase